jgi:hypothetical protein
MKRGVDADAASYVVTKHASLGSDPSHPPPPPKLNYLEKLRLSLPELKFNLHPIHPPPPQRRDVEEDDTPLPTVEEFTKILLNSPIKSPELSGKWSLLSEQKKKQYIKWFYSDRSFELDEYWGYNPTKKIYNKDTHKFDTVEDTNYDVYPKSPPIVDKSVTEYFEKFTKESLGIDDMGGGSRHRRRRSIPKSSRKYKKSAKRVFRKKSRSTRRR